MMARNMEGEEHVARTDEELLAEALEEERRKSYNKQTDPEVSSFQRFETRERASAQSICRRVQISS